MPDFDAIVIGGGITGAGVLRDLALRGLDALLIERGEPGEATTASSTHLIHGGLRYLLYDRPTTHTTCWDSGNIRRIAAPHLTRMPIVWPVYRGHAHGLETVETLLESYDSFQRMKQGLRHLRLSAPATLRLFPGLKQEGLLGSVAFDEWWVDAVGLVRENLASARRAGAQTRAGERAVGLLRDNGRVAGVRARTADGRTEELSSSVVVNAAGPWAAEVAALAGENIPLRLRKGSHLVYEGESPLPSGLARAAPFGSGARPPFEDRAPLRAGLLLEAVDRGRYVFIIPGVGKTLLGPTEVEAQNPEETAASPAEIRYLLSSARRYFKDFPERFSRSVAGMRPILGQGGSEKLLSREYAVLDHAALGEAPGLLSVVGGKMSDFRLMAQDACDEVCRLLGRGSSCRTHLLTLSGESVGDVPDWPRPWKPLKSFLRAHPRLRELHSQADLGAGLARHAARRTLGLAPESDEKDFLAHYRQ